MIKPKPTNRWHEIVKDFPKPNPDYPGILVVRDPFKRAVSMYNNRICMARSINSTRPLEQVLAFLKKPLSNGQISFVEFCRYLLAEKKKGWVGTDIHFVPQTYLSVHVKSCLKKEDFKNGKLFIINCDRTPKIQDAYHEFYRRYAPAGLLEVIHQRIDSFASSSCNVCKRAPFADLPHDVSRINMVDWKQFPAYERFSTEETRALIREIYDEDYQRLAHVLS